MAEVKADIKMGDLLGMTIADGVYLMSDGKIYSDKDGDFEKVDETVDMPDYALDNAQQYVETQKLISQEDSSEASND